MPQVVESNMPHMREKGEVKAFWAESTEAVISNSPTGIDISRCQDGYWHYLDIWEKQIALENSPDGLVLDLGCGTGRLSHFLRSHGKRIISVDYITKAVSLIKAQDRTAPCASMDSTALGLRDATFDGVIACRVLQSLPTTDQKVCALHEIKRILKKDGLLVLTEGNPLREKFVPVPYNFFIGLREWKELLKKNGFVIVKVRGIPFLTASKALDRLTAGNLSRTRLPFRIASLLDRHFGFVFPKFLSLQVDIIARKA